NLKKYNLNSGEIVFEDQAIRDIIKYYTREAGVRELNRKIQVIVRKFIVRLLQNLENKTVVTPSNLKDYLKKRVHEFTPKQEGPSAGIALTTAILSALTNQKVPTDIGMTGEITSKGKVLEIGGLKEKAIAACRSELKTIVIPKSNEKDVEDIPEEIRQELKIL